MRPLVLLLALAAAPALAQDIPARGTDATFDVAAWNIEHFGGSSGPSNDALQIQNAQEVLRDADIDLWALEEVKLGVSGFASFIGGLADQGLEGQLGPSVSNSPTFDQRLAFVWDPEVVEVIYTRTVQQQYLSPSNFGGRQPFEMKANVRIPGQETFQVIVIALHAKCCSDNASYTQRSNGADQLKAYTDLLDAQGIDVIVMGDFNDRLNMSITSGRLSPYRQFLTDSGTYRFATEALDAANTPTFCSNGSCSSGSTIDHLLFTQGLFSKYVEGSGDRYGELLTSISAFTSTTSDHLPVLAQFESVIVAAETVDAAAFALAAAPTPFGGATTVSLSLPEAGPLRVELYDVLGRRVRAYDEGARPAGPHRVRVSGDGLAPGVYTVRVVAGDRQATTRIVRR